jgi:HPt (histidine-containing phosphotransfer) domain-containing protein
MTEKIPPNAAPLPPTIADALARLWTKFRPEMETRVSVLEAAAEALAVGSLSDEQRELAVGAAHKLAGTLGTFGLHRGTALASECEQFLAGENPPGSEFDLETKTSELRALIKSRS